MRTRSYTRILFSIFAAFLLVGGNAWADKKPEKEAPQYPNATRKDPKLEMSSGTQKDLNKALDLLNDQKPDEAAPLLQKIIDDAKASKYAHAVATQAEGQIAYDKQDNAGAVAKWRAAYDMDALPNNQHFNLLYNIAAIQQQDEKYQDSLNTLDEFFKATNGGKAEAYALQGNDYYRLDKYQPAIDAITKAQSMTDKPNDNWNQILMASYAGLDQYDKAGAVLEKQLAQHPGDPKLVEQAVKVYVNGHQYDKAQSLIDQNKGSLSNDTMYTMYRAIGAGYSQEKDSDNKAIDAFAKASTYATTGEVDYYRGSLLLNNDRAKEATAALQQAITKGGLKETGKAYLMLGDAYNQIDDSTNARAAWTKAKGYPESEKSATQRLSQGGHVKMTAAPKKGG
jgi:predicted negative regulator of RcsB-dependent stress response